MQAAYIPCVNTPEAINLGPENLAATLARYSRSNKGIHKLLEEAQNKKAEEIFKFIDYGHASIGGLTGGIAIAIDDVSMICALKLFEFSQQADGQESSTRYITLSPESLLPPSKLGIPEAIIPLWMDTCLQGLKLYEYCLPELTAIAHINPKVLNLPNGTVIDEKVKKRLIKNYALDRSRNFLPVGLKTNVALIMSARAWAETLKMLGSINLPETNHVANEIRKELSKAAPNLIRHSYPDRASQNAVQELLTPWENQPLNPNLKNEKVCSCQISLHNPDQSFIPNNLSVSRAFLGKTNRYSATGNWVKRQTIQVGWDAVAIAEIRDLNRHRNGYRCSNLYPCGFSIPPETLSLLTKNMPNQLTAFLQGQEALAEALSNTKVPGLYAMGLFLGSQTAFEHTQPLDKFIYEAELRTGLGAHFKYCELLTQATNELFKLHPCLRPFIQLGTAEPE